LGTIEDYLVADSILGACKSLILIGSSGRTRTYNPSVNSRMLYH
jgi:hypothetical protein